MDPPFEVRAATGSSPVIPSQVVLVWSSGLSLVKLATATAPPEVPVANTAPPEAPVFACELSVLHVLTVISVCPVMAKEANYELSVCPVTSKKCESLYPPCFGQGGHL